MQGIGGKSGSEARLVAKVRVAFWISAVVLGALQAWSSMHSANQDGIVYLDIADQYLRRDWLKAANPYWSPLYPFFLALGLAIARPSAYWEFAVAHSVNFTIYIATAASFEFLLAQLVHYSREVGNSDARDERLPEWILRSFGYLVFLWSSLELISLRPITPDMCTAATVYLAAGVLLRIKEGGQSLAWSVALGLALGLGYLAKTVMFPLAFVFFALVLIGPGRSQTKASALLVALLAFSLVAMPLVVAISKAKRRVTFGESGQINYVWFVNGYESMYGPVRAPKELLTGLGVRWFAGSAGGTDPLWYDPSYWMEGLKPRFSVQQQLHRLFWSAKDYAERLVLQPFGACFLTCLGILLLGASVSPKTLRRDISLYLPLIFPGVLGLLVYASVLVTSRYIAPFVVLVAVGLLSSVRLRGVVGSGIPRGALLAASVVLGASLGPVNMLGNTLGILRRQLPQHSEWEAAAHLLRLGVRCGDSVGLVGSTYYWARLARVKVPVQMKPQTRFEQGRRRSEDYVSRFWSAAPETQRQVLDAMARAGVVAVVADNVPPLANTSGWHKLGNTGYYAWIVKRRS